MDVFVIFDDDPRIGELHVLQKFADHDRKLSLAECSPKLMKQMIDYYKTKIKPESLEALTPLMKCIKEDDVYLQSNDISGDYSSLHFEFHDCHKLNRTNCIEKDSLYNYIQYYTFISLFGKQVDYKNQEEPLQFIGQDFRFVLNTRTQLAMTVNSFNDTQNRFGFISTDPIEQTFISMETAEEYLLETLDSSLSASVFLELSNRRRTYVRQAYTFF